MAILLYLVTYSSYWIWMEAHKAKGRDNGTFVKSALRNTTKAFAAAALLVGLARSPEANAQNELGGAPLKALVTINPNINNERTIIGVKVPSYLIPKYLYRTEYNTHDWNKRFRKFGKYFSYQPSFKFYYELATQNYKAATWHPNSELARMKQFAMLAVNMDRISNGERPVTWVNEPAAQQHANSMITKNYMSHWNTEGMLPYMRYSLFGGCDGAIENCDADGYVKHSGPAYGIAHGLWAFMFDDANEQNGHRYATLMPTNTGLSIGIAVGGQPNCSTYLDEEFITKFIKWDQKPTLSNGIITLSGSIIDPYHVLSKEICNKILKKRAPINISVSYNKPLTYLSPETLRDKYQIPYPGQNTEAFAAGSNLITVNHKNKFKISMNIRKMIQTHGAGEYTFSAFAGVNVHAKAFQDGQMDNINGGYFRMASYPVCATKTFFIDRNGNQYNPELTVAMR